MVGDAITYDPFTFRKHFKSIGRAYREQATTLIEICRLYVETYPQTYTENDGLQNILRLADAALSAAGKAKKGTTTEATEAFTRLQEEIKGFGPPSSRKGAPGGHRKKLPDPSTALESASKKDKKSTSTLSRVKSAFNLYITANDSTLSGTLLEWSNTAASSPMTNSCPPTRKMPSASLPLCRRPAHFPGPKPDQTPTCRPNQTEDDTQCPTKL
ncbi:hypothetical protein EDB85DRAFT_2212427 [Lactarius pseudohatsudake]|nr:hypothetical protein EDB85DRAFT_2212427 [Lactarius pseudohatsudake]